MNIKLHDKYTICNTIDLLDTTQSYYPIKNKNYYNIYFYGNPYWLWVYTINDNYGIICILKNTNYKMSFRIKTYIHMAILIDKDGQKLFNIVVNESSQKFIESIFKPKQSICYLENELFKQLIPNIDTSYGKCIKNMCIGVLLITQDQITRDEWFSNKASNNFISFVNLLGKEINMDNWNGYCGNMGANQVAIYNHWKGIVPIIYHIAPLLDTERIRQLIGNDLLIIIYVDEIIKDIKDVNDINININLSCLDQLGNLPQCFAIIYKIKNKYLLRFITTDGILDKGPFGVNEPVAFEYIEEIMLTKFYNIMSNLHKYESFKKMYEEPRRNYINTLVKSLDIKKLKTCEDGKLNDNLIKSKTYYKLNNLFERNSFIYKNGIKE